MPAPAPPTQPSLPWRTSSSIIMGITGMLVRGFMFGTNTTKVHGLDQFTKLLDERMVVEERQRGLITGWWSPGIQRQARTNLGRSLEPHECVGSSALALDSLRERLTSN
jgi:hypothetical protein